MRLVVKDFLHKKRSDLIGGLWFLVRGLQAWLSWADHFLVLSGTAAVALVGTATCYAEFSGHCGTRQRLLGATFKRLRQSSEASDRRTAPESAAAHAAAA
jgi:hypothetical protein